MAANNQNPVPEGYLAAACDWPRYADEQSGVLGGIVALVRALDAKISFDRREQRGVPR